MKQLLLSFVLSVVGIGGCLGQAEKDHFVQRPFSTPPEVRPPPYYPSSEPCPRQNEVENWVGNLCGDLNTGRLPMNPFGLETFPHEGGYPFDLMKNLTLDFFRRALPVLKTYKALPKVARFGPAASARNDSHPKLRERREIPPLPPSSSGTDTGRAFGQLQFGSRVKRTQAGLLDVGGGGGNSCENTVFCKFLSRMYHQLPGFGRSSETSKRGALLQPADPLMTLESARVEDLMPQTPCPSAAEYVTPVFARNHEGAWRYVVQIPREGYFTQTVEVTKCLQSTCLFLQGSCRSSPRWQSLLVAEMFYPDAAFPLDLSGAGSARPKRRIGERREKRGSARARYYEGKLRMDESGRVGNSSDGGANGPSRCDGYDEIGCYQFRLFYDWFLIPGECKCWKQRSFPGMLG